MRIVSATILVVLLAAPAMAQPWEGYYQPTASPRPDHQVLVLNPEGGAGADRYDFLSLADLMAPVYTFPDAATRYVAVKVSGTRPVFTAADMSAGGTSPGLLTAAPIPRPGGAAVWIAVAAPTNRPLTYAAVGASYGRTDRTGAFVPQPGTVTLGSSDYTVWVGNATIASGLDGNFMFFARGASVPASTGGGE